MANEAKENEETVEDKIDETTAGQKLEEKAKKVANLIEKNCK
mgnify:CR=1 FL=1